VTQVVLVQSASTLSSSTYNSATSILYLTFDLSYMKVVDVPIISASSPSISSSNPLLILTCVSVLYPYIPVNTPLIQLFYIPNYNITQLKISCRVCFVFNFIILFICFYFIIILFISSCIIYPPVRSPVPCRTDYHP
jgi:hypothetical protein